MHESNQRLETLFQKIPEDRLQTIYNRHKITAPDIAALINEICLDGANTIASLLRGLEGVSYLEVVQDVAEKVGVEVDENENEEELERIILDTILQKALKKASPEEKENIEEALKNIKPISWTTVGASSAAAITTLIQQVGGKVAAEALQGIIMRILGKEVAKQSSRIVGLAVPLLNIVLIGWTIIDVAGPAFRKTLPTVVDISMLRMEFSEKNSNSDD